jgi:catechol 2,3-dioxygenase-like lactoylglutathione lyase family enzyme
LIEELNAITLFTSDMVRSVSFYRSLGFELRHGGESASFTTFAAGPGYLNLMLSDSPVTRWGRAIFFVDDVDAAYAHIVAAGITPSFAPRDASWGERYFHVLDPDGHEISLARPIGR